MNDLAHLLAASQCAPGVYDDMPAATYHAYQALSATGAKKILRSPAHYRYAQDNPSEPTAAMLFGTAVHEGVLEPATFADRVACAPDVDKRTKAGKADWADFVFMNEGKVILAADDFARAQACVRAVLAHPAAGALLDGARREVSLFWDCQRWGIPRKARLDAWKNSIIIDLKTCADASPAAFAKDVAKFLYHVQAAQYCEGYRVTQGVEVESWLFIAAESDPPHAVAVYSLPWGAIQAGERLLDAACERYRDCTASGIWPGYAQIIETLTLPAWAFRSEL